MAAQRTVSFEWLENAVLDSNNGLVPYTSTFNILDYAAVSFPTGIAVDKQLDQLPGDYTPFNPVCKAINTECKCSLDIDI